VPERSDELLEVVSEATEAVMQRQPGFISANLHVNLDRRRVVNYAQWH
jgi:quinol monooxygenase YgiN